MEKFTITPNGINHNSKPAFVANWFNGEITPPQGDLESFYYEGSGENDSLSLSAPDGMIVSRRRREICQSEVRDSARGRLKFYPE